MVQPVHRCLKAGIEGRRRKHARQQKAGIAMYVAVYSVVEHMKVAGRGRQAGREG